MTFFQKAGCIHYKLNPIFNPIFNRNIEPNIGPDSEPNIEPNIEPKIECNILDLFILGTKCLRTNEVTNFLIVTAACFLKKGHFKMTLTL